MFVDLPLNHIGIRGIVSDDVLEVEETVRINTGELDGNCAGVGTDNFPFDSDLKFLGCSFKEDFYLTGGPRDQFNCNRQQAAAYTEVAYFFAMIHNIICRYFGIYLEAYSGEAPILVCHIFPCLC